jgi:hypothetical protein
MKVSTLLILAAAGGGYLLYKQRGAGGASVYTNKLSAIARESAAAGGGDTQATVRKFLIAVGNSTTATKQYGPEFLAMLQRAGVASLYVDKIAAQLGLSVPRTYAAQSGVTLSTPSGSAVRYDKSGKPIPMGSISGNLFTAHRVSRGLGSLG